MIYRIIYLNGPHKGERITITREPMSIGRSPSCAIHLPEDPEISEQHCTIIHGEHDELKIHDDGSMNSILINSHEVTDSKLKHGDTIEIGRTRFLVQAFVQADVNRTGASVTQSKSLPVIPAAVILVLLCLIAAAVFGLIKRHAKAKAADEAAMKEEVIPPALFKDIAATEPRTELLSASNSSEAAPVTIEPSPPEIQPVQVSSADEDKADDQQKETLHKPQLPPETPSPIEIISLTQQKFPEKDEYDEMRVVTLQLKSTGSVIDNSKVAVKFDFYDRDLTTGDIAPARAIVPVKALQVTRLAEEGEETLTATYTVPKGLRNARAANSGMTFYGVHVKVMYSGELAAEKAVPRTLLGGERHER